MYIFKIKNLKTGLFSKGGWLPTFTKNGKIWSNIGHVKNSVSGISQHYEGCVVQKYELKLVEEYPVDTLSV